MHVRSWGWFHYYWRFSQHLGQEAYKTWRWELLASVLVGLFVAIQSGNWKDFRTALIATGMALGCIIVWHIVRIPWLLHKSTHGASESEPGILFGLSGMVVLAGLLIGGYSLGMLAWDIKPLGTIVPEFRADAGAKAAQIEELERALNRAQQQQRPTFQRDPEIEKILRHQEEEISQLKSENPSPKKKALELSNDIIKFVADETRSEPIIPIRRAATGEEFAKQQEEDTAAYQKWGNEINVQFQYLFARRIAYLEDDVRALNLPGPKPGGLPDEAFVHCENMNGSLRAIERCGIALGALASKLP